MIAEEIVLQLDLYSHLVPYFHYFYVLLKRIVELKMSSTKKNQRNYRSARPRQAPVKKDPEPPKLLMLKYGRENNFAQWKEAMRNEVAIEYGLLASIIDEGELVHPADVIVDDYDEDADPNGFILHALRARLSERQKTIARMEAQMPKCRALMWKHLSRESMEAVHRHEDYDDEEHRNDPLQLFLSIKATHSIGGEAHGEIGRRAATRQAYKSLAQGPYETIAEFKLRFTRCKEAYDEAGNVELPAEDIAMDFLNGLDNGRYSRFKVEIENDSAKGVEPPDTLHDMFLRASTFKVEKSSYRPAGGAAFATRADDVKSHPRPQKDNRSKGKEKRKPASESKEQAASGKSKSKGEPRDMSKITCFNCNEQGHMSYNCPNDPKLDDAEHGTACATFGMGLLSSMPDTRLAKTNLVLPSSRRLVSDIDSDDDGPPDLVSDSSDSEDELSDHEEWPDVGDDGALVRNMEPPEGVLSEPAGAVCVGRETSTVSVGKAHATMRKLAWYEVLLDNQADISVVNPRLLTSVRRQKSYVSGLSGTTTLPYVGHLDGFFECKGSTEIIASVLCMADVEDLYDITYEQGDSYTVHLARGDLVFERRDKLYVADMRDWASANDEIHHAMVTTVADNESKFTAQEVKRARQAQELIENAGFSSEKEAVELVSNGNLTGVPVTARDVKRAYEIYGKPVAGVRGRRTAKKAHTQGVDPDLKSAPGEAQVMYGDVVYFRNKPYVMCLTKPLGLVTMTPVANTKTKTLAGALHQHVATIQTRGFHPTLLHLDPQKGFAKLEVSIPGLEVDIGGAGDHMNVLDVEVRHLKEVFRSVHSSLPWKQPEWLNKDLVSYVVSRKNLRGSSTSVVSARVKFTGRKPDFKKELSIGYGDYCECYNPAVESKDASKDRTEPCVALYPTGNANGSWWFLNIATKRRVRRTNWTKMVTSNLVVNTMNEFSRSDDDASLAEEDEEGAEVPTLPEAQQEMPAAVEEEQPVATVETEEDGDVLPDLTGDSDEEDEPATQQQTVAEEPQEQRRSARIAAGARRSPVRYRSFHTSVRKGLKEHGRDAYKAIVAELRQLLVEKKALKPVHRGDLSVRQLKTAIRSLMFLKTKFDGLGRFEKIKARLVANGKQQDRTLYPDTYSPTVALQSVLMCLTVAAAEKRKVCAVDIGGAYLNAERESAEGEEVIMELEPMLVAILAKVAPEVKPFIDEKGRLMVELTKAMYGTLDAAKIWYEKLTGVLHEMGFVPNKVDPCVLNKVINGKQCTVMVYVDDLLVTCESQAGLEEVVAQLEDSFEGDIKSSSDKDLSYLGMHLKIDDGRVVVSMEAYLQGVLEELEVKGSVSTPATANLFNVNSSSPQLSAAAAKNFHTVVAKLLYLAKRVRLDVLLAVAFLSTRVKCPTEEDKNKLDRVLKYLNGTKGQVLVLSPNDSKWLEGYIDASFGCHFDGKSHTGLVIKLYGCTIMCMSSKQKLVTRDSTEAELVGLSDKLMTVIQCADFLREQGVECGVPKVYQDNTSTITLVTKGGGQYRSKYMRVRQAFVQERCDAGEVEVSY